MIAFNKIVVEPTAGTQLGVLKQEMSRLSNKYKCDVVTKFNGQDIIVGQFNGKLL